jgi:hypothetical protein
LEDVAFSFLSLLHSLIPSSFSPSQPHTSHEGFRDGKFRQLMKVLLLSFYTSHPGILGVNTYNNRGGDDIRVCMDFYIILN